MKKIYSLLFFGLIVFHTFSQTYTITTGLPNNIISGSGAAITGLQDDNWVGPFNIGFNFPFFNINQTRFFIAANGSITFSYGDGNVVGAIPNTSTPNNFIAFASTDQLPATSISPILNYFVSGSSPNRILVINYQNIKHYSNSELITSVQLQLFEGSGKIEIHNIQNNSGGFTRTIGIENSTGTIGFTSTGMNSSSSINLSNQMIRFSTCASQPSPSISPSIAPTLCSSNPSTTLTAICSTGTLSWSTEATTSAITINPTQTTTYTATCLDNSCQTSSSITVPVLQTPSVSPNGTNYLCTGNSLTLTSTTPISGANLQWYKDGNSMIGMNSINYNANSNGLYQVKVSKEGCLETSNIVTVIENTELPQKPILTTSRAYVCGKGGQTILTVSGCNGTVNWYISNTALASWISPPTGLTATATVSGNVKFNVTCTVNGCTSTLSDDIYVDYSRVNVIADNYSICNNENINLTATPFPNINVNFYIWDSSVSSSNNNTAVATAPGTYNATVVYSDGCQVSSAQTTNTSAVITNQQNIQKPNLILTANTQTGTALKVWDKRFGTADIDVLKSFTVSDDKKSYILVGTTTSFYNSNANGDRTEGSRGKTDYWVIKVDTNGNKVWDKRYGTTDDDILTKSLKLKNKGQLLIGYTQGSGGDKSQAAYNDPTYGLRYDGWFVKIDSLGNKIWDKQYGGNIYDLFVDGFVENDNSYILAGHTNSELSFDISQSSKGYEDYWVIKIDSLGNKIWDKRFGGSSSDYLQKCVKTSDGGILLGGRSYSGISGDKSQYAFQSGIPDYWLLKLNSNGIKQWDKTFHTNSGEDLHDIVLTNEGDILFVGNSNNGTDSDIYKLNSSGNLIWRKIFPSSAGFNKLIPNTKGILVSGETYTVDGIIAPPSKGGYSDSFIMQLDSTGNKIWDRRFGGSGSEELINIAPITNGYIAVGSSDSPISGDKTQSSRGGRDYWLARITNNQQLQQPTTTDSVQTFQLFANNCIGTVVWSGSYTGQGAIIDITPEQTTSYTATCLSNDCSTSSTIRININPCGQIVSLTQTENIITGTSQAPITFKAQDTINATNTIGQPPTNVSAKYAAGKSINLNPGFKVEIGSIFQAKISATPCNE